jgi:hypothetical protein
VARHAAWAHLLFRPYLHRLLRSSFHEVTLLGKPPRTDPRLPLVLVGNHATWWDGFFPYLLNERILHRRFHVMMLEEQLDRFPFFRRLGAFGITPGRPRGVLSTLTYAASLLEKPEALLVFFPQGELLPFRTRPLGFQRGLDRILELHGGPVAILPFVLRCEFRGERRPHAFLLTAPARTASGQDPLDVPGLEREMEGMLDQLESGVMHGARGLSLLERRRTMEVQQ